MAAAFQQHDAVCVSDGSLGPSDGLGGALAEAAAVDMGETLISVDAMETDGLRLLFSHRSSCGVHWQGS